MASSPLRPKDPLPDPGGELTQMTSDALAEPRVGEPSCCCSAPPRVRVILAVPGGGGRTVDILLCQHHYRRSAHHLAERGALCVWTPTDNRLAPVSPIPGQRPNS